MQAEGYIRRADRQAAELEPSRLPLAPGDDRGPYFSEEIRQYLERTYGEKDLYRRGLRWTRPGSELQAFRRRPSLGPAPARAPPGIQAPRNRASRDIRISTRSWTPPGRIGDRGERDRPSVVTAVSKTDAQVRIGPKSYRFLLPATHGRTRIRGSDPLGRRPDPVTLGKSKTGDEVLFLEQDPREQGRLHSGNGDRAVRAMVGGYDWTSSKFTGHAGVTAGRVHLQPFVYLAALEPATRPPTRFRRAHRHRVRPAAEAVQPDEL